MLLYQHIRIHWQSNNIDIMLECPLDEEIGEVLADVDVTTIDSQSMLIPNNIALSRDEDPTDEPKLKPSEAYALVLGHRRLRNNSVKILQKAQAFRGEHSQIDIPLCRMVSLQVVCPALAVDIEKMKADFVHGYRLEDAVFYVSTTDFSALRDIRKLLESPRGPLEQISGSQNWRGRY